MPVRATVGAVIEMQYAVSFPGFLFLFFSTLPACSSPPPGYQDVDSGLHREVCRRRDRARCAPRFLNLCLLRMPVTVSQ